MQIDALLRSEASRKGSGQHKIVCPACGPERKKKTDRTLSLSVTSEKILYRCWHCQQEGILPIDERIRSNVSREALKVVARKIKKSDLTDQGVDFLRGRGISRETAEALGIKSATVFVRAAGTEVDTIVFPYKNNGATYAEKMRWTGGKGFTANGSPATLWNIENVQTNDDMIICEGEMDAASFVECGYESATSIPNGAPQEVVDGEIDPKSDTKFGYIWEAREKMELVNRVIICIDSDGPGKAAAEEMARRIGKDVCWRITLPEGFKDANEVLMAQGQEGIDKLVSSAEPWPISGLYDSSHYFDQVDKIFEDGLTSGLSTGYASVDKYYTIGPGMLTVVTGHPSMGKSEFVDQIMVNLAKGKGWKFAICSFENEPRLHITKLMSKYLEKHFSGRAGGMTDEELAAGKDFVQSHFSFVHQSDGDLSTVESIIQRLKVAVKRHGIRGAVIDPYNYIVKEGDGSETEWISSMLSRVRAFAQAYGLHIWFVAHPTKMQRATDGNVPPPKGYDISGSAAWFAKADHGLTVHRPSPDLLPTTNIISWKSRFSWLGQQGSCSLSYDKARCIYIDDSFDPFEGLTGYDPNDPDIR